MAKVYNIFGQDLTLERLRTVNFSKCTVSDLFEILDVLNSDIWLMSVKELCKFLKDSKDVTHAHLIIQDYKEKLEAFIKYEFQE